VRGILPLALVLLSAPCTDVRAESGAFMPLVTDSLAVFPVPDMPLPQYRLPMREPTFGTAVVRVSGDAGQPLQPLGSVWSSIVRHEYATQAAWNSDGTLLSLDNNNTQASPLIVDGETYEPRFGPCGSYDRYDWRWHPNPSHPNEQVNVNQAGTELMWFDVTTCQKTRSWPLPIVANYGIGSGKGNPSRNGRYVVVANDSQMVVVDMDPQPPWAPYPNLRIGPVVTIPPCSLDVAAPGAEQVNHVAISPSGRYIDVKYKSQVREGAAVCDTLCDLHRIFEVDDTLGIRVHAMDDASLRCGSFQARPNGWVYPLKHADMTIDPFDRFEDVLIGGRACPGSSFGRVVKVRLRDGKVTPLSNPVNEPPYLHGSARNVYRPGWFYVTYSGDSQFVSRRFFSEVVAVRLDGSGEVERLVHYRSRQSVYESQVQAVPSPDGGRVLLTSDWCVHGLSPCPSPLQVYSIVVDARAGALLDVPGAPPASRRIEMSPPSPNPSAGGLLVRLSLPSGRPTALEVYDVTGRRVALHNVGLLGPGEHVVDLDAERRLPTGVYLVALTDGRDRRTTKAVLLR